VAQLETPRPDVADAVPAARASIFIAKRFVRVIVLVLIAGVSCFAVAAARALWREYDLLRGDLADANRAALVGYPGISPELDFAERPQAWYRQEGDSLLLWGGWVHGRGHRWYRADLGALDPAALLQPHPAVVPRAIDFPEVETGGGKIWQKIPDDVYVVGGELAGRKCVYPLLVLMKVEVINDVVEERPFLVTANILSAPDSPCAIFDATLEGRRITMAPSGYYHGRRPVLYDRKTESLWIEQDDKLTAIAGAHKGKKLARLARPVPVEWRSWRKANPDSRLIVGANRTHGVPDE
jgi:hypothetical protein